MTETTQCPARFVGSSPVGKREDCEAEAAVREIASKYRDPDAARFAINDFRDWLAER